MHALERSDRARPADAEKLSVRLRQKAGNLRSCLARSRIARLANDMPKQILVESGVHDVGTRKAARCFREIGHRTIIWCACKAPAHSAKGERSALCSTRRRRGEPQSGANGGTPFVSTGSGFHSRAAASKAALGTPRSYPVSAATRPRKASQNQAGVPSRWRESHGRSS